MAARPDVATLLARRRGPLEHHLPEVQHQQPGDVEAVGEEGAVARVRAFLGVDPADGEDRVLGLAGEQVPRLAPPPVSSPMPVEWRRSISAQSAAEEQTIIVPV